MKKITAILMMLCLALTAAGCGDPGDNHTAETTAQVKAITNLSKPDMTKWKYSEEYDIFYQAGIPYCETPADERYEQLACFVPGAYMEATDNGDGTYTCKQNDSAEINGYTAAAAPMVMPVNTAGYASDPALSEEILSKYAGIFEEMSQYTSQGFVYVHAGCRGITEGAPSGVTDLKAAVRYVRYSDDILPGDAESIFVYGMSGGGAQAAILGASGDSALYDPYLEKIGAVQGVSDAIAGSCVWCPVCDLNTANAAYEWMMGCTRTGRTEEQNAISDGLANAYAAYVNSAGFTDKDGAPLTLTQSADGIYQAGSYYDYLKRVIEESLNHYLSDTQFTNGSAQAYIDGLNKDKKWIDYDKNTNTATITGIADFVKACKQASDASVAFDPAPTGNTLFGYGDYKGSHFDRILADVLTAVGNEYASAYTEDLKKTDACGNTVEQRVNMYAPLYYLLSSQEGYGTSAAAKYWRIRSGIQQNTNALTTEVNLALALEHCDGVRSVDFETVWARAHEPAERTGDSTENFIKWVNACMKE